MASRRRTTQKNVDRDVERDLDTDVTVDLRALAPVAGAVSGAALITITAATLTPIIHTMNAQARANADALQQRSVAMAHLDSASLTILTESVKALLSPPRIVTVSPPPAPAEELAVS